MENKININGIKEQLSQKANPENIRLEPLGQPTKQVSEQVIEPSAKKVEQKSTSTKETKKQPEPVGIIKIIEPFIKDKERKDYLLSVYNYYLNLEQIAICTTVSKIDTFIHLAIQGLDPLVEEVYLTPTYKDGIYILNYYYSYKGLKNQAFRTGLVKQIETNCVFQGDIFTVSIYPPTLQHTPNFLSKRDETTLICAYSIMTYTDDTVSIEIMSKNEIEKLRQMNPKGKAWLNYSTMAQVKVLKRHLSKLPRVLTYDFTDIDIDN